MIESLCLRASRLVGLVALVLTVASCADGDGPRLLSIPMQRIEVGRTLRLPLAVNNPDGESLTFSYEGPMGLRLNRAMISGTPTGGEFRWAPLVSEQGTHEFTFTITYSGGSDQKRAVIEVVPGDGSAPVFATPGPGRAYRITEEPCIDFDIEVIDNDSPDVEIRERGELPMGAEIESAGERRASFHWCPTPEQISTSLTWQIQLEADDDDHPPTRLNHTIKFITQARPGCPGAEPTISFVSPAAGATVTEGSGFDVVINAADDMGFRDPPTLYFSQNEPENPAMPDVTEFDDQVPFVADGSMWRARVPTLGLEIGEMATVYLVASVTDNDDATGTDCDHTKDSALRTIEVIGGEVSADRLTCDECSASTECVSGLCAIDASGARCLDECESDPDGCVVGECTPVATVEGVTIAACGPVPEACGDGPSECTDDAREEDDSLGAATSGVTSITDGQICEDDVDFFEIDATTGEQVQVTVDGFVHADGDLDLYLVDGVGTTLGSSSGTTSSETVTYCLTEPGPVYAKVLGYNGAQNHYALTIATATGACCENDPGEPDNTRETARAVEGDGSFDGTICPSDTDYVRFNVAGPSDVSVLITFDPGEDLDLQLYSPTGALIHSATSTGDSEMIERAVSEAGTYTLRVYPFRDAASDYVGEIQVTPRSTCTSTNACPVGQVCSAGGSCVSAACPSGVSSCPPQHLCPMPGRPPAGPTCRPTCTTNSNCRSSEACKWFPEGRACGPTGTGANGSTCFLDADCGGQRTCLDWTNGYCARAGCATSSDCETDAICVEVDGENVCIKDCLISDDICRLAEGYRCAATRDVSGGPEWGCVPSGASVPVL